MAEIRWINKNKSCIEIFLVPILQTDQRLINKNKSCIEMASDVLVVYGYID